MEGKKESMAGKMLKAFLRFFSAKLQKLTGAVMHFLGPIAHQVYELCYYVGATVLYYCNKALGKAAVKSRKHWKQYFPAVCFFSKKCLYGLSWVKHDIAIFFKKFNRGIKVLKYNTKAASKNGFSCGCKAFSDTIVTGAVKNRSIIKKFLNYSMPATAFLILAVFIGHSMSLNYALAVQVNGTNIGYVTDESVYTTADKLMQDRIVYDAGDTAIKSNAVLTVTAVSKNQINSANEICDSLIQVSGEEISQADGLYVDGKLLGATTDGQRLEDMLKSLKANRATGDPNETVEFVKNVQVVPGLYAIGKIVDYDTLMARAQSNEQEKLTYTVVQGDTPIGIAQKNGITYSQLASLNPGLSEKIMPGQQIVVQMSQSMLRVKVVKTIQYTEAINFTTETVRDSNYTIGTRKVVNAGSKGENLITAQVTYIDGVEVGRLIQQRVTTRQPVNEKVIVGTRIFLSSGGVAYSTTIGSGKYIWPVPGGYISCYYRGYVGHTGLDIAAPLGTPILAVDAGTVVVASTLYQNGKYIVIDHGNGVTTLYAHCNALYVTPGQQVAKGQIIAQVGRTGRATGPHLHIEFKINGSFVDPLRYLS